MAIGQKTFLQPLTNIYYMHSFEKNTQNSKTKRYIMVIEGIGTLFHQYSKFKSEKYPWMHILWEIVWKIPKNFFTLECKTWQNAVIFHSLLMEDTIESHKWVYAEERQWKWKCPTFTKPFNIESGITKAKLGYFRTPNYRQTTKLTLEIHWLTVRLRIFKRCDFKIQKEEIISDRCQEEILGQRQQPALSGSPLIHNVTIG